jgi:hypothetical protein
LSKQYGDFQTPLPLAKSIIDLLTTRGKQWSRIFEPTCGTGTFIEAVLEHSHFDSVQEIRGVEIQPAHAAAAQRMIQRNNAMDRAVIIEGDIFKLNLPDALQWKSKGPLLVLGNPPWVTNADLGKWESANLPAKRNIKSLSGLDALTGSANFDIAESIWLQLLRAFADENATLAMLCKTSVARNLLADATHLNLPVASAAIYKIDSMRWFAAAVDACLTIVELGQRPASLTCPIYDDLEAQTPCQTLGIMDGKLVANITDYTAYRHIDGESPMTWRQGLKHDAASVMELQRTATGWQNKLGETVTVEEEYVFPLFKGSDLNKGQLHPRQAVILTQHALHEDTHKLQQNAPLLWAYLCEHEEVFARRKSSIYRNQPQFAMFGIGDYLFSPYKVAISGLHKTPHFRLITPYHQRPVMFDDTCYFLPCATAEQAAFIMALLEHTSTQTFIHSILFTDTMRPITKRLLQRVDLRCVFTHAIAYDIRSAAQTILAANSLPVHWSDDADIESLFLEYSPVPRLF